MEPRVRRFVSGGAGSKAGTMMGSDLDGRSVASAKEGDGRAGSGAAGLVGALFPLGAVPEAAGGKIIDERSWLEIAADRLWACPRRGLDGKRVGEAMPLSDFVGLVPITVMESPDRTLPPTNSLPPRLCP